MDKEDPILKHVGYRSKYIYHYCSLDALKGIIENKCLWVCSATHSNDKLELKYVDSAIDKLVKDGVVSSERMLSYKKEDHSTYIACFSEESDLLSQWRGYGDDGGGVSIGFDQMILQKENNLSTNLPQEFCENQWFCHDVVYRETELLDLIKSRDIIAKNSKDSKVSILRFQDMILYSANFFYKSETFEEEKEVRIIYIPNKANGVIDFESNPIAFRVSNGKISPYAKMDIPKNSIKEIILGPKNKMNETDINLFLKANGYTDIIIKKSSIPYC